MNGDLPQGWVEVPITDVVAPEKFAIVDGPFGSDLKISDYVADGPVPVLTTKNLTGTYDPASVRFISQAKFEQVKRSKVVSGDILMAKIGSIGKCSIYPDDAPTAIIPANLCKVSVDTRVIYNRYLYWQIRANTFQDKLKEITSATAQPAFSVQRLKTLSVTLAPLAEQQRIVAKLGLLLGQVEACQQRLDKIPTLLKRFRQAVLAAACSGKLTEDWRAENQPEESGEDLLRRIIRDRRCWWEESQLKSFQGAGKKPKDDRWKSDYVEPATADVDELEPLTYGWAWGTWDQVSNWVTYGFTRPMPHVEAGFPIVTARHVVGRKIELTDTDKTTKAAFDELSAKDCPQFGDILITKDGSMGRAALVETDTPFCINQSVAVVWLRSLTLDRKFLLAAIEWPLTQHRIAEKARGAAIQHLSITDFARLPLPIPPLSEQQEIVRRVERLLALADNIEQRYKKAQTFIDKLTPSLLAKAFRGELVPQDPNDEPASVLLERIRVERGKGKPRRRGKD